MSDIEYSAIHNVVLDVRKVMRASKDQKIKRLSGHPLFARFGRRQLTRIAELADFLNVKPGTLIANQGSLATQTFVIFEGEAIVQHDGLEVGRIDERTTVGLAARARWGEHEASVVSATNMILLSVEPRGTTPFLEFVPEAGQSPWCDLLPSATQSTD